MSTYVFFNDFILPLNVRKYCLFQYQFVPKSEKKLNISFRRDQNFCFIAIKCKILRFSFDTQLNLDSNLRARYLKKTAKKLNHSKFQKQS